MLSTKATVLSFVALYSCMSITVASPRAIDIRRRDGPTISSTITQASQIQSVSAIQSGGGSTSENGPKSSTDQSFSAAGSGLVMASSTASESISNSLKPTPVISAVNSNINGAAPTSVIITSFFNETATPGKLPLTPEITPAYAVAGVILMLSGSVYTFVGIKNRHLHICLSAGYLASLAVTVLILYVMNPPLSNAIQGAYLVAIAITGVILGGAAVVFAELTEGLGCLLGGFALSMWLLVLKPGGLLTSTSAKSAFIAAFTLAGFATSFSHLIRPYALIGFISFAGATVVVLGIDCVSRAGLKEFWAYVWNLNNNLFPVGATTYPLTRGTKVELAAIIVIFMAGVMSQMKLWKVIKERREQRALERLEDERNVQREEENVGNRIEQDNAEERNQWEAVYGEREVAKFDANQPNRDSGLGDMDSQKKGPTSTVTSLRRSGDDEIEMADLQSALSTKDAGVVMSSNGHDGGPITIRVAQDPENPTVTDENGNPMTRDEPHVGHLFPPSSSSGVPEGDDVLIARAPGEARLETQPSKRNSLRNSKQKSIGPEVVPLPFKVPQSCDIEDSSSSVATFADDEPAGSKRDSKRLSANSAFLRRLSKKSNRSSKRFSTEPGSSTEDLIGPRMMYERPSSRESSLAATMDGMSDGEDARSIRSDEDTLGAAQTLSSEQAAIAHLDPIVETKDKGTQRLSSIRGNTDILDAGESKEEEAEKPTQELLPVTSGTDQEVGNEQRVEEGKSGETEQPACDTSVVSATEVKSATLTRESLPPSQSKVVMSYRTNEWAKHLSKADAPDLEELKLDGYPAEAEEDKVEEVVPVNVEELQQTAGNSSHVPTRPASLGSKHPILARSASSLSKTYNSAYSPRLETGTAGTGESLSRSTSQLSLHGPAQPQLNTRLSYRSSSTPLISQPIVESPTEDDTSRATNSRNPYGSQPTLIGHRDTILRSKSSLFIASPLSSTPELSQAQFTSRSQSQLHSSAPSQAGSDDLAEDDTMPLSQRRDLIRQQSLVQQPPAPFDTHQPRRQSSAPHPLTRESQLASFRASVQDDFVSAVKPRATIERQRSQLWMEKQAEEQRRSAQGKMKEARDRGFGERMRRGDMLTAHRDALRRMQAKATGNT